MKILQPVAWNIEEENDESGIEMDSDYFKKFFLEEELTKHDINI